MVLVVDAPHSERDLEDRTGHTAEVDGFLQTVRGGASQVGEQVVVEDVVDLLDPVLLGLTLRQRLLEVLVGVLGGVESIGLVGGSVHGPLDVGVDDWDHPLVGDDGVVDVRIRLHPQRLHEGDQEDAVPCGRELYVQGVVLELLVVLAVLLQLDDGLRAESVLLGEDLCGNGLGLGLLAVLDQHPVGSQVLERDQDPLGTADDEVSSGIPGVLLDLAEVVVVLLVADLLESQPVLDDVPVEAASPGFDHHGEVADLDALGEELGRVLDGVLGALRLVDGEVHVDRRAVVEVPEPGLHGGQRCLGTVGLDDDGTDVLALVEGVVLPDVDGGRGLDFDLSVLRSVPSDADDQVPSVARLLVHVDPDESVVGAVVLERDFVDDPLHPAVGVLIRSEEVIEGRDVVVDDVVSFEIKIDQIPHLSPSC